jgi:hypothetical protein
MLANKVILCWSLASGSNVEWWCLWKLLSFHKLWRKFSLFIYKWKRKSWMHILSCLCNIQSAMFLSFAEQYCSFLLETPSWKIFSGLFPDNNIITSYLLFGSVMVTLYTLFCQPEHIIFFIMLHYFACMVDHLICRTSTCQPQGWPVLLLCIMCGY